MNAANFHAVGSTRVISKATQAAGESHPGAYRGTGEGGSGAQFDHSEAMSWCYHTRVIPRVKEPACHPPCAVIHSLLPGVYLSVYTPRPLRALPKIPPSIPLTTRRNSWHRSMWDM